MKLRDYQQKLYEEIFEAFTQRQRVLVQLATAAGKTFLFAAVAKEFTKCGLKVLVLAHTTELIQQCRDELTAVTNQAIGVIKAGVEPHYDRPIQVASIQSLKRRLHHLDASKVGLVVVDEAHHSTAATYRDILEHFSESRHLGLTATPIRTDGQGFTDLYDVLLCGPTVEELIKLGYLSPFKLYATTNPMTTDEVRTQNGDYLSRDLAKLNNAIELSGDLVQTYHQYASGLRCVVFAVNVAHSKTIVQKYNKAGIPATHIDSKTPQREREAILTAFRTGEIKVISNVSLFIEGLNIPDLMAVQIARPTQSLGLWLQMVGRVLRPFNGKRHAIIMDHTLNHKNHGLPTHKHEWSLLGVEQRDETVKRNSRENIDETVPDVKAKMIEEEPTQLVEINAENEYWHQRIRGCLNYWIYQLIPWQ